MYDKTVSESTVATKEVASRLAYDKTIICPHDLSEDT